MESSWDDRLELQTDTADLSCLSRLSQGLSRKIYLDKILLTLLEKYKYFNPQEKYTFLLSSTFTLSFEYKWENFGNFHLSAELKRSMVRVSCLDLAQPKVRINGKISKSVNIISCTHSRVRIQSCSKLSISRKKLFDFHLARISHYRLLTRLLSLKSLESHQIEIPRQNPFKIS